MIENIASRWSCQVFCNRWSNSNPVIVLVRMNPNDVKRKNHFYGSWHFDHSRDFWEFFPRSLTQILRTRPIFDFLADPQIRASIRTDQKNSLTCEKLFFSFHSIFFRKLFFFGKEIPVNPFVAQPEFPLDVAKAIGIIPPGFIREINSMWRFVIAFLNHCPASAVRLIAVNFENVPKPFDVSFRISVGKMINTRWRLAVH